MFLTGCRETRLWFNKPSYSDARHRTRTARRRFKKVVQDPSHVKGFGEKVVGCLTFHLLRLTFTTLADNVSMPPAELFSILLKEALTARFLNGHSMQVVLSLIHDCTGAIHKRHRKQKEKLDP